LLSYYSVGNQLSLEGPIEGIGVTGGMVGAGARLGVARFRATFLFLATGRFRATFARVRRRAVLAFPFRLAARFLFATLCPPLMI
jgi:hypothetical protein